MDTITEKRKIIALFDGYTDVEERVIVEGIGLDTVELCSGVVGKGGCVLYQIISTI